MSSYDKACKQILSNKIILAWILKHCIKEFTDYEVEDIAGKYIEGKPEVSEEVVHVDEYADFVEGMNNEDATMKEGTFTFDIKFKVLIPGTKDIEDMIVNVEAQKDFYPGYPIVKRGIYYASRMISSQYGTVLKNSDYNQIKKVSSIWICTQPPKYRQNTIAKYGFTEEVVYGNVKEDEDNYNLMSVVIICLGTDGEECEESLLNMLSVLLSDGITSTIKKETLQNEFGIPMTEELEREVDDMCNLSQGVYDKGYDKALADAIRKMMDKKGWDVDECMDTLDIPEEKRTMYREAVQGVVTA
jgi:hypothetical protein